jgi:hypothetical protein
MPRHSLLSVLVFVLSLSNSFAAPVVEEKLQERKPALPVASALNIVNSAVSGLVADGTVG